jgi:Flp pilus assembly pilin Flp
MDRSNLKTRLIRALRQLAQNQHGGTTLEWALLLAVVAIPSYFIIQILLSTLVAHYQMITTLNGLPFP